MSEWYNEDQVDHMRSLAKAGPAKNCWCGWNSIGDCWGKCNDTHPGKSAQDKQDKRDEELAR